MDENGDAALSRQGNETRRPRYVCCIDDLADTYRRAELNEIIREARAFIPDEDGNVRNLGNPEK